VAEITAPELLEVLGALTPYLAQRMRQVCERVFAYAIGAGAATSNPAAMLRGVLAVPPPVRHRAAIVDPEEFRTLCRLLREYIRATPSCAPR
jgi:hypothetical protein